MPRPVGSSAAAYNPGLDGIRALAVAAVVAYHLGVPHMAGGLLGVAMFFTLSGYLITGILLAMWNRRGSMDLGRFWLQRARRLLPALIVVLIVVLVATALWSPENFGGRAIGALASMFYVSNWSAIAHGSDYFNRFSAPGPFDHFWSLAIEEQFYVVWPLVLWGLLKVCRGRIARVALITAILALISFVLLGVLAHGGLDGNTRAYEGTDTRAGGLLVGALVAMLWHPGARARTIAPSARAALDAAGVLSLFLIGYLIVSTNDYSLSIYRGGLLWLTIATAVLVAVVAHRGSDGSTVLGVTPLRWIGERSYGIYLWHLPVIVAAPVWFLKGQPVVRDIVLTAIIVGCATLSWHVVEDPIRTNGFLVTFRRFTNRLVDARSSRWLGAVGALAAIAVLAGVLRVASAPGPTSAASSAGSTIPTVVTIPATSTTIKSGVHQIAQSSCTKVVQIGDSTSEGLISTDYLPNPATRINAQLGRVGVREFRSEIAGAQSVVETWHGQPNAQTRVLHELAAGFRGCWIFALGTNDAADVAIGSHIGADQRVSYMMDLVPKGEPVLWLTVKSLVSSGPYADSAMTAWNTALTKGCTRFKNMRIYNWRPEVQNPWFISDGIHFTSPGYVERSRRIAGALAAAFPKGQKPAPTCLVRSGYPG